MRYVPVEKMIKTKHRANDTKIFNMFDIVKMMCPKKSRNEIK